MPQDYQAALNKAFNLSCSRAAALKAASLRFDPNLQKVGYVNKINSLYCMCDNNKDILLLLLLCIFQLVSMF